MGILYNLPVLKLSNFTYHLPTELIAQSPAVPRDSSRLLILDRQTGRVEHYHFHDLPDLLTSNDVLVRNNTKVIPARIFGEKSSGGHVEVLLTKRLRLGKTGEVWECLTKPGLKPGQVVTFTDSPLLATCQTINHFTRDIEFNQAGVDLFTSLEKIGHTPLPPYIDWEKHDEHALRQLYQTTYAKFSGSAAAPTAGLHFTPELDEKLRAKGIQIEEVTLHVGLGTFLRVKVDDITQHQMHSEVFELKPEVAERLNQAKQAGKRIISVGTTTTRVLETCATEQGKLQAQSGETQIFIYPPYRFKFIDSLITNFHESQSTLLMLVSSLVTEPNTPHTFTFFNETVMGKAYQAAQQEKYRFLSFGDAMWIQ
jgi:S-adenosylmethionine:tRNA ribosyltransferase-isomerase